MAALSRKAELEALKDQLPTQVEGKPGQDPAEDMAQASAQADSCACATDRERLKQICEATRGTLEQACCRVRRQARETVIAQPLTSITAAFVAGLVLARAWRSGR